MTSSALAIIAVWSLIGTASCQFRVPLMLVESNWTSSFGRANTPIHERLENHMDMDYIGEVKLGTPGQTFRIIFDTGSADFWVPSIQCTDGCHDRRRYDPSHSSSHIPDGKQVSIQYGSGEVRGVLGSDTLHLGDGVVPAQPFAEITHASQGIFRPEPFDGAIARDVPFDGIIGLAYPKVSSLKVKPVFDAIMEKKLVPQSVFSFYLGSSSGARPAGELVLGGINHERFKGSMHYVSVSKKRHWEFQMDRVQAGSDKRFCVGGCWTVVDSGSSFIEGPQEEIDRINKVIGAQKTENGRDIDLDGLSDEEKEQMSAKPQAAKAAESLIEATMTEEQKTLEKEAQRKQLEEIYRLMAAHSDKFGDTSMEDIVNQMALYR